MSVDLLFHEKSVQDDGSIVEMKIWKVPVSERSPDGIRYSLYWVKAGKILVGYDNHQPKGHHRHYGDRQESYDFKDMEQLIIDFQKDMEDRS